MKLHPPEPVQKYHPLKLSLPPQIQMIPYNAYNYAMKTIAREF